MRDPARVQAAIEILDAVIDNAREGGAPADRLVRDYFRDRRYAGSKDRRAVRELVFAAVRRHAAPPPSGRAAMLGLAQDDPALLELFDGSDHAPAPPAADEVAPPPGVVPEWLGPRLSPLLDEPDALLERAPLDLRVNVARASREGLLKEFPDAQATPHSPWGLRLPTGSPVDRHPAVRDGLAEVQDEASQLVALACRPQPGEAILDLCAGAGGKSLALAAAAPGARIIASDTDKRRLGQLRPRAEKAEAVVETILLDPPREAEALADFAGKLDTVLVDAPCSGSGTWRRSPELRWRLTPERLADLVGAQARLLDLAAPLVRPGGRLVYAVCSIVAGEGAGQAAAFLSRHSGWTVQTCTDAGRADGDGRLMTPGHDGTDGFFMVCLTRDC